MNPKRPARKGPGLGSLKVMLASLSVFGTLGLWGLFSNPAADLSASESQPARIELPAVGAPGEVTVQGSFQRLPKDTPVKIIIQEGAAPRPLAVTRSSR